MIASCHEPRFVIKRHCVVCTEDFSQVDATFFDFQGNTNGLDAIGEIGLASCEFQCHVAISCLAWSGDGCVPWKQREALPRFFRILKGYPFLGCKARLQRELIVRDVNLMLFRSWFFPSLQAALDLFTNCRNKSLELIA